MSGRRGRGYQYSNLGRGGRRGCLGYGLSRGRSRTYYNAPQMESDYQSAPASAYSVQELTVDAASMINIQPSVPTSNSTSLQPSSSTVSVSEPAKLPKSESSVFQKGTPPPASSKATRFPLRPGSGTVGMKYEVRANHFLVLLDLTKDIHHYDVKITPEISSKKLSRRIITQLIATFRQSDLDNRRLAYDGRKSAYTAGPLPFNSKEFDVTVYDDITRRDKKFTISIKFAAKADLHYLLDFLNQRQVDAPQETIQALDVVFRDTPSAIYETVGRSFFSPTLGTKGDLGEGIECWKGFYQSLRPTQMGLSLTIDISATPFHEPVSVTEFITKLLNIPSLKRPLSQRELVKVKTALKGVIVETNHLGYVKRQKVSKFTDSPLNDLWFSLNNNEGNISVVQYFLQRHNIQLQYKFLPAFQYTTDSKPIYLPLEICKIAENQRYTKKLSKDQRNALSEATCERPTEREGSISTMVRNNSYNTNNVVRDEFGIHVIPELAEVTARVLPPPMLKYDGTERESLVDPKYGSWSMKDKKMVNGGTVNYWTCVTFSKDGLPVASRFCKRLVTMCCNKGMVFSENFLPFQAGQPNKIEELLTNINNESLAKFKRLGLNGKRLQLLIVILPDIIGSYGTIKRVCETKLGLVSQCCKPNQASKATTSYLENVALKINVKVGGRNIVLEQAVKGKIPFLTDVPTMVFGADVTHPSPGEDSGPSIAAVVGSMDWPEVTKYRGLVSAQKSRQEIIQNLYVRNDDPQKGVIHTGMIRELLLAFYHSTSQLPQRIIFYRDGVSEGQFNQVLLDEINAIRKACVSLQENYLPPITFIVVQKRHHTRLFPVNLSQDRKTVNILPGTVVDTEICHPMEFDFFLCSHAGDRGTSHPAHYHVLFDENNFSVDDLQILTNNLCYTYARCTKSLSKVPPAHYAHLAAYRARYYIEGDDGHIPQGAQGKDGAEMYQLPAIIENVKDVMFFC